MNPFSAVVAPLRIDDDDDDDDEKNDYLRVFQTLYPNGLGTVTNTKYLALCCAKTGSRTNGASSTVVAPSAFAACNASTSQYFRLTPSGNVNADEEHAEDHIDESQSVTLTPGDGHKY